MVSARPPPNPARGRISYPSAVNYTSGDADASPVYHGSEPIQIVSSQDEDRDHAGSPGLKTWFKSFGRDRSDSQTSADGYASGGKGGASRYPGVFGVELRESIEYASVQISTTGDDGALYVWGTVPVVVAKCGLYLKEHATEVEGTFRISGSAKRMRELQAIFDTGPKYGKNIDWKPLGFTEHDVATIFRRFLTQMPESIIPFDYYEEFRATYDYELPVEELSAKYKTLIRSLPPINQWLLLYVLDLLHVFAKNSDKNLMNAANLALIFQPGMLTHPAHAMRPRDHVLSQQVVEFLIEHQDSFLVGMELKKKKARSPASSPTPTSPPPASPPPAMVKADADLMLPSDSDSDAPEGGYYVVESKPRTGIPKPKSPVSTQENPVSPSFSHLSLSPRPAMTSFGSAGSQAKSQTQTTSHSAQARSHAPASAKPQLEQIEPSDSDDEAPPGGYEVHEGDVAKNRQMILERARTKARARTGSDAQPPPVELATGLNRRKTVPAKLFAQTKGGIKSREAP